MRRLGVVGSGINISGGGTKTKANDIAPSVWLSIRLVFVTAHNKNGVDPQTCQVSAHNQCKEKTP
jgi:hypothetical protein